MQPELLWASTGPRRTDGNRIEQVTAMREHAIFADRDDRVVQRTSSPRWCGVVEFPNELMIASASCVEPDAVARHTVERDVDVAKKDVADPTWMRSQHSHQSVCVVKAYIVEMAHSMRDWRVVHKDRDLELWRLGQCATLGVSGL